MKDKTNSGWNYRVIKFCEPKLKGLPQAYYYGICEVYYKKGKPHSWSEPMHPIGETFMGLWEEHNRMALAFLSNILEIKDGKLIEISRFK